MLSSPSGKSNLKSALSANGLSDSNQTIKCLLNPSVLVACTHKMPRSYSRSLQNRILLFGNNSTLLFHPFEHIKGLSGNLGAPLVIGL